MFISFIDKHIELLKSNIITFEQYEKIIEKYKNIFN